MNRQEYFDSLNGNRDFLQHHGILGSYTDAGRSRYGVSNIAERYKDDFIGTRVKRIYKDGWKKGHGKNVYTRLERIKKEGNRFDRMSEKQKESFELAEKYWKNRASGKGISESGDRNIIKRFADAKRSKHLETRLFDDYASGITTALINNAKMAALVGVNPGVAVTSLIKDTTITLIGESAVEELFNKLFGHF